MKTIDDSKLNEMMELDYSEKVKTARNDYISIMKSVDPEWEEDCVIKGLTAESSAAASVHMAIQVLAATIVFGNYCFSETESDFLEQSIDLDKEKVNDLQHCCEEYFYDTKNVFDKFLVSDEQKENLAEIMLLLATVDGHISKKELKWINKMLSFIL